MSWEDEHPPRRTRLTHAFSPVAQNRDMTIAYTDTPPTRQEVDALAGPSVLEFGTAWCGYCQAAQPAITEALSGHAGLRHLRIEDGPGRALGRSFRVKLWPTLVFMKDGQEMARVVRPRGRQELAEALRAVSAPAVEPGPSPRQP